MPRRLIALLVASYAIAFAFAAMAAIRWPSLMMLADVLLQNTQNRLAEPIDWRRIGITYGGPYFLAALALYASAIATSNRRKGAVLWYISGVTAGFPAVFLVEFEPLWWQNPSIGEGLVAGAGASAVLLGAAVWSLRRRHPVRRQFPIQSPTDTLEAPDQSLGPSKQPPTSPPKKLRRPVSPAIAFQRAKFAEEGRRMLARQRRG